MKKKTVIFEPSGLRIMVDESLNVLEAAHKLGLHINSECGGRGTCGKCLVILQPAPAASKADRRHISEKDLTEGARLACSHEITGNMRVVVSQAIISAKILTDGSAQTILWKIDRGVHNQKGVAIDVGTTTIVVYLLDLETGVQLGYAASLNPQVIFGEDVMSRINYAMTTTDGTNRLKDAVLGKIDDLVLQILSETGIGANEVSRLVLVGNPVMHHLLLGLDVSSLGKAPYEPIVKSALNKSGRELGLESVKEANAYLAPNIAGFVGGDTAAFILSQQLYEAENTVLGIDIGTNGEIVLSVEGKLYCCSAAAGSAFEGATIKHGMRGQEGAIEHLIIKDANLAPDIYIIGNGSPKGLCGSGIVDTVAELRTAGIIEPNGKMLASERVAEFQGEKAYVIAKPGEHGSMQEIIFTQRDVRQVQLAKGAILAGVSILLESAGVSINEIDTLLLAGAFGNYIDPEHALSIGLLPPIGIQKVIPVGNAAGEGAKRLLLSREERFLIENVVKETKYVELARYRNFSKIFSRATILAPKMPLD